MSYGFSFRDNKGALRFPGDVAKTKWYQTIWIHFVAWC